MLADPQMKDKDTRQMMVKLVPGLLGALRVNNGYIQRVACLAFAGAVMFSDHPAYLLTLNRFPIYSYFVSFSMCSLWSWHLRRGQIEEIESPKVYRQNSECGLGSV